MKEKTEGGGGQFSVSPPILIAGGLAIIAIVYLLFFSGPSSSSSSNAVNEAVVKQSAQNSQPVNNVGAQNSASNQAVASISQDSVGITTEASLVGKDPFVLPGLVQRSRKANNPPAPVSQPSVPVPIVPLPKVDIPKVDAPEETPVWKGLIKTSTDQLAIITFKGRSYLLHQGERIPGTEYRITELNSSYVVLESPSKQLKLQKKGERK